MAGTDRMTGSFLSRTAQTNRQPMEPARPDIRETFAEAKRRRRAQQGNSVLSMAADRTPPPSRPSFDAEPADERVSDDSGRDHKPAEENGRPDRSEDEAPPTVVQSLRNWMKGEREESGGDEPERRTPSEVHPEPSATAVRQQESRDDRPLTTTPAPSHDRLHVSRRVDSEVWRPAIDPIAVMTGIWNAKSIIAATTVIGAILGVTIALSTPKMYVASADVIVDPRDIKISDRDLTAQGLPSDATLALVENQVRLMYAPQVMERVVRDLDLVNDPRFNEPSRGISALLKTLRSLVSFGGASSSDGDSEIASAANDLADALDIARADRTFVVSVEAETRDPQLSADIVNAVIEAYVDVSRNLSSATAGRAESEITARLDDLRTEVEAAERAVEAFRTENDLVESQGRLITDEEILRLNEQLANAQARLIELEAKARSIRETSTDAILGGGLPEAINSSVISELRAQYARLRQQAESLATRLGPRHPQRIAIESQLRGAREQMAGELRRIAASAEAELRRARQQRQDLADRLAQMKVRQGDISDELVTLRQLEREAAAKRNIYETFLLRARDAGEQKDIDTTNISVIGKAQPPLKPTGPSRSSTAILFTILGFLTGLVIGAIRGVWNDLKAQRSVRDGDVVIRDRYTEDHEERHPFPAGHQPDEAPQYPVRPMETPDRFAAPQDRPLRSKPDRKTDWNSQTVSDERHREAIEEERARQDAERQELAEMRETVRSMRDTLDGLAARMSR